MSFYDEKVFPLLNEIATSSFRNHKRKILQSVSGRVLEIGFGSGTSIGFYPQAVTEVVGIEPNPGMIARSLAGLAKAPKKRPFKVIAASAELLPFESGSFDSAVSFLTLCSVSDPTQALSEIYRVLKPGGKFYFLEHMGQRPGSYMRSMQERLQPLWIRIACGCHLERDTLDLIMKSGLAVSQKKIIGYNGFPNIVSPIYRGIAERS